MYRNELVVFKHNLEDLSNLQEAKNLKVTIAQVAYRLFNDIDGLGVSLILWNDVDWKEIFKLVKKNLWIEKIVSPKDFEIKQFLEKDIDWNYKVDALVVRLKWKNWKYVDENVTAVFEDHWDTKKLIHLHISEPKILRNWKVEKLPREFNKNYRILEDKKNVWKWVEIESNDPNEIAKTIITKYWKDALTKWAEEVVKLFGPSAYLKWTVVGHISVWDAKWVKAYFEHFCEKNPEMQLNKIQTRWLTPGNSILSYGEYTFTLDTEGGRRAPITGNFTFIFKKINSKWVIDVLHSSVEYDKQGWKKLNNFNN